MDINERKKLIGKRLNTVLAMRNVKQKDLAKHLGIQDNAVSYFCKGDRTPNTAQLAEICDYLEISADYLLGLSEVSTPNLDVHAIAKATGLSENSSEFLLDLKDYPQSDGELLNTLIKGMEETSMTKYFGLMKEAIHTPSARMCVVPLADDPTRHKEIPKLSVHILNECVEEYFHAGKEENRVGVSFELDAEDAFVFYCKKIGECLSDYLTEVYECQNEWSNIESFKDELIAIMKVRNEEWMKIHPPKRKE